MILRKPSLFPAVFTMAAMLWAGEPAAVAAAGLADAIGSLDPHPCYVGELVCVTLPVPLDHDTPGDNRTLEIDFAIHLSTGANRGVLVFAVGGPGQAGVGISDWALWTFDPKVLEHYDIVLFDQRGTGPRHGVDCRRAAAVYSLIPWNFEQVAINVEQAGRFVADCIAESGRADILPFLGTRQAVRDLEIFRQAIGAPPVWLYGASYGSYFAQAYAAAYPDAIAGLILDGVMDPGGSIVSDANDSAAAAEQLLRRMSEACSRDPSCDSLFPSSVVDNYDRMHAALDVEPREVGFPLSSGRLEPRTLTADMMSAALSFALYTPFDRTAFLHALAAAAQGAFVPMLRMAYRALEFDPDTMRPLAIEGTDSGMYWGAFYAISCPDYVARPADATLGAHTVFEAGLAQRSVYPRFFHYLIGLNLECQFWPGLADKVEPAILPAADFKTLLLTSDVDHATPMAQAVRVYERLDDATLIAVEGGRHVVLGWGDPCVDDVVTDWLVSGREPRPGRRLCKQALLDGYYSVDMAALYDPDDAADLGWGLVAAINSAELTTGWEGAAPLRIGCEHGGTMTLNPPRSGGFVYRYKLDDCRIWQETGLSGTAIYRATDHEWTWQMELVIEGANAGMLDLEFDLSSGAERIDGTLDGQVFVAERAAPAAAPVKTAR